MLNKDLILKLILDIGKSKMFVTRYLCKIKINLKIIIMR